MKFASIVLALAGLVTGPWAAFKWWQASRAQVDLGYREPDMKPGATFRCMGMQIHRTPAPADTEAQHLDMTVATWDAMTDAAALKKHAAAWTAASVFVSALTSIVGTLS